MPNNNTPIRFKTEVVCGMAPGESVSNCSSVKVPIRDWDISPQEVKVLYNGVYPLMRLVTVTFPEIENLSEYADVKDLRYSLVIEYGAVEYFDVVSEQLNPNNLVLDKNGKVYLKISWKNLAQLPDGITNTKIKYCIFGKQGSKSETLLEYRYQNINIRRADNSEAPSFDKERYDITYNRTSDTFIGDTLIKVSGVESPLAIKLNHSPNQPIGFDINPPKTADTASIQRKANIAQIYNQDGKHYYGLSLLSESGGSFDFANLCITVVSLSNKINTNLFKKDWNFCLDNNFIEIQKATEEVDRLRLHLKMTFQKGKDKPEVVNESYEYVFVKENIKIFPGEEIHDFFHELQSIDLLNDLSKLSSINTIVPTKLFSLAKVEMIVEEFTPNWNLIATHDLGETYWIPGKKPKAFPYLTNGQLRRTYTDSMISICAVKEDFISNELNLIASPLVDLSELKSDKSVVNAKFKRSTVDGNYGGLNIVKHKGLALEPATNPQGVINCVFENQNFCPDWFSFTTHYEKEPELNHIMAQNLSKGRKYKTNVEEKHTLRLNTGWIWKEELELLEELIVSRICYVQIKGEKLIKCVPLSKKPLKHDFYRNLHQMLVEFEIMEDER